MSLRVAINGFGRIGKLFFRAAYKSPEIEVVQINDLMDTKTLAHLLKWDSTHGAFPDDVSYGRDSIIIGNRKIKISAERDPATLPWKEERIDVVVESTGIFTNRAGASKHLEAGAKKVVISAPAKEPDITIVIGVNHEEYEPNRHHIVSCASCTTNCLAPVAKVLLRTYGIEYGLMTTTHAYTNDQRTLDFPHSDLRRARTAAVSMIPTTTGAAKATSLVLPELKGKIDGMAIRVPTPNVSLVDFTCVLEKETNKDDVNKALANAAENELKGILDVCDLPLVSIDFNGNPLSSIVDALSTTVLKGKLAKVISWYDNEWGYSNRLVDMVNLMGEHL
ncbi:MAG: type I glyceraldehyde-3-phosphate dehydrogenase [Candidatus Coatesbacteria bacterium]|nr:type I glyceraldehyde-3-phosphate dehydrogenase [Candidatus Coatesbacteria bacterium]